MATNEAVLMDHKSDIHKKNFIVNWCLGNICNYRCSYCTDMLNDGTRKWVEYDLIIRSIDKVMDYYSKDRNYIFEFTGGEVTLYKDLIRVLEYLKSVGAETSILSNGSPKIAHWTKLTELLDYVTLSYHADHSDPEHFFSVVEFLHKNSNVHVNIMMHPQYFEACCLLGKKIMDHFDDISLSFQPLLKNLTDETTLIDYSEEQLATIKSLDDYRRQHIRVTKQRYKGLMREYLMDGSAQEIPCEQYIAEKKNRWMGWLCWSGLEQIVISQEGSVFRAWCLQDYLGNIRDEVRFPGKPVICTKSYCHCNLDIATRKQRQIYINAENQNGLIEAGFI